MEFVNQLKLIWLLALNHTKLKRFCSLDFMYFWAKNNVKEINQAEFFDFILQCTKYELNNRKGIEALSDEDEQNIFGGLFDSKLKSAIATSLVAVSAVSFMANNDMGKASENFKPSAQCNKSVKLDQKTNNFDKSKILKTVGKVGVKALVATACIGSVGFVGGYAYRKSDNVFQRTTIGGSSQELRNVNNDFGNLIAEKITIDNGRLQGYKYTANEYVGEAELSGKYVIFYSGSGLSNTFQISEVARHYAQKGATVIGVDYEGFGESGKEISAGKIRQENIYKDAVRTYNYVKKNLNVSPSNIIIHGYSLGGPVAAHVAAEASQRGEKVGGLILQSSMKNTPNAAKLAVANSGFGIKLLGTLGSFLFADQFDCEKELKKLYKYNPNIKVNICGGNENDKLRLEWTTLDKIAEDIGFENLKVYTGEEGHMQGGSAPVNNFDSNFKN